MNNKIFITCVEIRNHENCFSIKIAIYNLNQIDLILRTCNSRVAFNDKSVGQPNMLRSFNLQLTAFFVQTYQTVHRKRVLHSTFKDKECKTVCDDL